MDKQEVRVGWKVTADNMRSCVTVPPGKRGVEYKRGAWAQPDERCGPLCVFDSLPEALLFAERGDRIWRCFYVPSRQDSVWVLDVETIGAGTNEAFTFPMLFWNRLGNLPEGTVLADAVYLIDEVPYG